MYEPLLSAFKGTSVPEGAFVGGGAWSGWVRDAVDEMQLKLTIPVLRRFSRNFLLSLAGHRVLTRLPSPSHAGERSTHLSLARPLPATRRVRSVLSAGN